MPVSETPVTGIILSVWSNEVPKVGMQPIRKKQLIEAALIDGFWLRHSLGGASDGDFSEAFNGVPGSYMDYNVSLSKNGFSFMVSSTDLDDVGPDALDNDEIKFVVSYGLVAFGLSQFGTLKSEMFPLAERAEFLVYLDLQKGSSLAATQEQALMVEAWLRNPEKNPEVQSTTLFVGHGGPRFYLALTLSTCTAALVAVPLGLQAVQVREAQVMSMGVPVVIRNVACFPASSEPSRSESPMSSAALIVTAFKASSSGSPKATATPASYGSRSV